MFVINDTTSTDITHAPINARGCIEPDYKMHPEAVPPRKVLPSEIKLVPWSDMSAVLKEKKERRSALSDIRRTSGPNGARIPSLQQNTGDGRWGYCWAHSATMAHMLLRAVMGLEYVKLSAFMVAAIIKNYKDQGGWGSLALQFIEQNGQCTDAEWPELHVDPRLDTPAMRAVAARHKVTADFADVNAALWDRNISFQAVLSLLIAGVPVVGDYNWWGHSVVLMDAVEIEPGSYGVKGLNSWGDQFGENGEFVLQGNRAVPDGAVAPMAALAV